MASLDQSHHGWDPMTSFASFAFLMKKPLLFTLPSLQNHKNFPFLGSKETPHKVGYLCDSRKGGWIEKPPLPRLVSYITASTAKVILQPALNKPLYIRTPLTSLLESNTPELLMSFMTQNLTLDPAKTRPNDTLFLVEFFESCLAPLRAG